MKERKSMQHVLAINAGSSSLKFQLIRMPAEDVLAKGLIERIGLPDGLFTFEMNDAKETMEMDIPNHEMAVNDLLEKLQSSGVIESLDDLHAVGHRVVHGGEAFSDSVLFTDEVIKNIEKVYILAVLNNTDYSTIIHAFII